MTTRLCNAALKHLLDDNCLNGQNCF